MNTSTAAARRPRCSSGTRRKAAAPIVFKAFIAYADLNTAREAMVVINQVLQASHRRYEFKPMLWRFDQLGLLKWREDALVDAVDASVVVLASAASGELPRHVDNWAKAFLARNRGRRTTVVALMGRDAWTISIQQPRPEEAATAANVAPAVSPSTEYPPSLAVTRAA